MADTAKKEAAAKREAAKKRTAAKKEQERPAGGANAAELTLAQAFQLILERPGDATIPATIRRLCDERGIPLNDLVREAPTL